MHAGRRRRSTLVLLSLTAITTPWALFMPEREIPGEAYARAAAAVVFRPLQQLGRIAEARPTGSEVDPRDAELVERFFDALDRDARRGRVGGRLQLATVDRVEGASARPTLLVLDTAQTFEEAHALDGAPVVHGDDLVGFVHAPVAPRDATDDEAAATFDGRLRVHLVDYVPDRRAQRAGATMRRLTAVARSTRSSNAPALRMLVEPGHPRDPFRLRVLRSAPRQLETWKPEIAPYLAQTASSERLHPGLPEGLVLGYVEDLGYRERSYVLQRYVEPRFDARSLVRVGVLTADRDVRLRPTTRRVRAPARVVWQSPGALSWRRALLRGSAISRGAAVVDGVRCLGRVTWSSFGTAGARTLAAPHGGALPFVLLHASGATQAIVVTGSGVSSRGLGQFAVEHPPAFDARSYRGLDWRESWVFTGVLGAGIPHGLVCGRLRRSAGAALEIELFGLEDWPRDVRIGAKRGAR